MKLLEQLEKQLEEKRISAKFKSINTEKINQERVYVNLDKAFQTYFIEFENKLFLKVYIQRAKGFNFSGIKQSELETERCIKAKLAMLIFMRNQNIMNESLETATTIDEISISPKSSKVKLDLTK